MNRSRISFLILFFSTSCWGQAGLSQWIYESVRQKKCQGASPHELQTLKNYCPVGFRSNLNGSLNFDQATETIFFHNTSALESQNLSCQISHTHALLKNKEIQKQALLQTCAKIKPLQDAFQLRDRAMDWINVYAPNNDANACFIRIGSRLDCSFGASERDQKIIDELKQRKVLADQFIMTAKASDLLLSSPTVYRELEKSLKPGLFGTPKPAKVCESLQKNLPSYLQKDQDILTDSLHKIQDPLKDEKRAYQSEDYKKLLWSTQSRQKVMHSLQNSNELNQSLLCRLDARYGRGAEMMNVSQQISLNLILAAVPFVGELRTLSLVRNAASVEKAAEVTAEAAKMALLIDVGTQGVAALIDVLNSCKSRLGATADPRACVPIENPAKPNSFFYQKLADDECLMSLGMTLISGGFTALNAHSVLSGLGNDLGKLEKAKKLDLNPESIPRDSSIAVGHSSGESFADGIKPVPLAASQRMYSELPPLTGRKQEAAENHLRSALPGVIDDLNKGGSNQGKKIFFYADGSQAVFKPHEEIWSSNYRTEVLAFEVDRKMGFGLVPPTVEATYNGKKGSLQLFVHSDPEEFARPSEINKQAVFDFLIGNRDRRVESGQKNYLVKPDRSIASIDNGLAFIPPIMKTQLPPTLPEIRSQALNFAHTQEGRQILANLKVLQGDPQFRKEVENYIGSKDTERFLERITEYIHFVGN